MKCGDVRTFLSQLSGFQPVQMQVPQADLEYLSNNGYLSVMPKEQYDRISAEVATLNQINTEMQNETVEERSAEAALAEGEQRTHSIMFHFESGEKKQAELDNLERERTTIQRDQIDISLKEAKITELIQKKSMIDRLVPFEGEYVSLTGLGVILFKDLNVRNYRVSDTEFSNYVEESRGTATELHSIAERANWYVSSLSIEHVQADTSQLWGVAIGLAKLQENQYQILDRFLAALGTLNHLDSPIDNKMMAAEIMTSFRSNPAQQISTDNSDIQDLSKSLMSIEHDVRHHGHVPKEQSPGVAATILSGRRYDGTYPLDRFLQYSKWTRSYESAAILSVLNVSTDQLTNKFQMFRSLFNSWSYETSEDTELSSAYLGISDLTPDDVKTKMVILLQGLGNYLEYPIVAAAILASIPTIEANETLDLMEKAYSWLEPLAGALERSEVVSLAVRMIHGIKNELVKELDPTATITNTPVQFTYRPSYNFFLYNRPIIVTHSSYYSSFGGIGGAHPGHVHGYGGGFGG